MQLRLCGSPCWLPLKPELQTALLEATDKELELGFLEGPFESEQQVSRYLGTDRWLAVRRFVIKQGEKHRPIDDAHECQLNEAFSTSIKLKMQDADSCTALAIEAQKTATSAGRSDLCWVGKCLDLSKAYKQLAVSERDRSMAVILIHATTADGPSKLVTMSATPLCLRLLLWCSVQQSEREFTLPV